MIVDPDDDYTEALPAASGRDRRRGPGGGSGPNMRRILSAVGVVVLVVVLGFVVLGSCSGSSQADAYRSYAQKVDSVATRSNADAEALDAALYNNQLTPHQVTAKVSGFIARAHAVETTAAALKPTGKIQGLQSYLQLALHYRTLALKDLAAALENALAGNAGIPASAEQRLAVADAYRELIASDVVYAASFRRPAQKALTGENVTDVAIVPSVWGRSPDLANPDANRAGLWIQSVRDAGSVKPCAGGSLGTSIDGVTANGKQLVASTSASSAPVMTVKLLTSNTFQVTVGNHGSCPVRGISIHVTEGNESTQVIGVKSLLPTEVVKQTFPATANPGQTKIDVSVPPVPGETDISNNHYTYYVTFQA